MNVRKGLPIVKIKVLPYEDWLHPWHEQGKNPDEACVVYALGEGPSKSGYTWLHVPLA